ncbi:transposase, partial [Methanobrevibacter filiformis]|uniref:transposase n=1 Tax=Methanobrevibacter filiformis TaxID=55758 RepID=UPI000B10A880
MVLHEDSIGQVFLLPLNLRDFIPDNHICFFIEELVSRYDFGDLHSKYADTPGKKAYSRRMLARNILMGQIDGIRSGRKLEKAIHENVVYMYLSGMKKPKYRTLINFRNENEELMEEMLAITVREAERVGIATLNDFGFDGSKIKANASSQSTIALDYVEAANKMLEESEKLDELEDEKYGDRRGDEAIKKLTLKAKTKKFVDQNKEENKSETTNNEKDKEDVKIQPS